MISQGTYQHYCLITHLNRFLFHQTKNVDQRFYCCHCLHGFATAHSLAEHKPYCQAHGPQRIKMPIDNDKWLTFKNYGKQLKLGFVIYADFECILSKVNACDPNPEKSLTTPMEKHSPCGYSYKVVCTNPTYSKPAVVYRGEDAVLHFIKSLHKEEHEILKILKKSGTHEIDQTRPVTLPKCNHLSHL